MEMLISAIVLCVFSIAFAVLGFGISWSGTALCQILYFSSIVIFVLALIGGLVMGGSKKRKRSS